MWRALIVLLLCCVAGWHGTALAAPVEKVSLLSFELAPYIHAGTGGAPEGAAVDLVKELFSRMHVTPEVRIYPVARSLALFASGQAGGIFTLKKTPARAAQYVFSGQPLFTQQMVAFVRKDAAIGFNGDLRGLAGHSIGLVRGASYGSVVDAAIADGRFSRIEYVSHDEWSFRKLLAGRIDVVICDRRAGRAVLRKLGGEAEVRIAGKPFEITSSYLAFNKGAVDADFLRKLNQAMALMQKDGSARRIKIKYGLL